MSAVVDELSAFLMTEATKRLNELKDELATVTRERNEAQEACSRWTEIMADELAESRRLMDLGGALEDENFTTFVERIIAERAEAKASARAMLQASIDEGCDTLRELAAKSAEVERLREALRNLADVSDDVGVMYFDGDSMPATVERMQRATLAAREALEAK